jgi:hypothetical protein
MRVVATRIEQDGTMQRRMVDTAHCGDGPQWEELARRALAAPPPYRPVPGSPIYHLSLDGGQQVLVAEQDLAGALLDLVTAVLAMGEPAEHARPPAPGSAGRRAAAVTGASGPPPAGLAGPGARCAGDRPARPGAADVPAGRAAGHVAP